MPGISKTPETNWFSGANQLWQEAIGGKGVRTGRRTGENRKGCRDGKKGANKKDCFLLRAKPPSP